MWQHITGVKKPAETNNQQKDEDESKKVKDDVLIRSGQLATTARFVSG